MDEVSHLLERMMPRYYELQEAEMLREFLYEEPIIITIRANWESSNLVDIPDGTVLWRTPMLYKENP